MIAQMTRAVWFAIATVAICRRWLSSGRSNRTGLTPRLSSSTFAHVQHHYWKSGDGSDCPQIAFAAIATDEILGKLVARCKGIVCNGRIALMNALSQTCTIEEPPWILYRPNNTSAWLLSSALKRRGSSR
jgi:hypothetical protein